MEGSLKKIRTFLIKTVSNFKSLCHYKRNCWQFQSCTKYFTSSPTPLCLLSPLPSTFQTLGARHTGSSIQWPVPWHLLGMTNSTCANPDYSDPQSPWLCQWQTNPAMRSGQQLWSPLASSLLSHPTSNLPDPQQTTVESPFKLHPLLLVPAQGPPVGAHHHPFFSLVSFQSPCSHSYLHPMLTLAASWIFLNTSHVMWHPCSEPSSASHFRVKLFLWVVCEALREPAVTLLWCSCFIHDPQPH